jgi:hypothetical protein
MAVLTDTITVPCAARCWSTLGQTEFVRDEGRLANSRQLADGRSGQRLPVMSYAKAQG